MDSLSRLRMVILQIRRIKFTLSLMYIEAFLRSSNNFLSQENRKMNKPKIETCSLCGHEPDCNCTWLDNPMHSIKCNIKIYFVCEHCINIELSKKYALIFQCWSCGSNCCHCLHVTCNACSHEICEHCFDDHKYGQCKGPMTIREKAIARDQQKAEEL